MFIYRREIDGLRALAVVPVIFFHAGFSAFRGGFIGVDVFFVISGYLITSIILAEKQGGTFTLIRFYERRARRILPALFTVMFSCLPFAWVWLLPVDLTAFSQSLIAVSAFASNILFWRTSGYFESAAELKPLLHTWSLAVEEQYYLLFPIFLLLTWRLGKRWTISLLFIAAIISLAAAHWSSATHPAFAFFLLPTRGWEILVGAFMAFYLAQRTSPDHSETLSFIGLLLIAYAVFAFDRQIPFPSLYTLIPTIGAALIITFATEQTYVGRFLSSKFLVGMGLISYSAYLWHQPLFAFARHRNIEEPSRLLLVTLIFVTVGLAYLSWRYIETPFRNVQRVKPKSILLYGVFCSTFFVVVGVVVQFNKGYSSRFDPVVASIASAAEDKNPRQATCLTFGKNYLPPNASCILGSEQHVVGALLGDSHADAISYALEGALGDSGLGMRNLSYGGCPPVIDVYRADDKVIGSDDNRCWEYNNSVRKYVLSSDQITTVILVARWTIFLEKDYFNNGEGGIELPMEQAFVDVVDSSGSRELNIEAARKAKVKEKYRQTILTYLNENKKVILVYPIPEVGWDVPTLAARMILFDAKPTIDLSTSYAVYKDRNRDAIGALDSVGEHMNLVRIRPDKLLCDTYIKNRCAAQLNGVPLYYDDDHLSTIGARLVVAEIMQHVSK